MQKGKRSEPVNAPAVIIAPQHQSAPKFNPAPSAPPRPFVNRTGDYDTEMDLPEYTDESQPVYADKSAARDVEAALEQFEKNCNDERVKQARWLGQERWQGRENEEMRKVNIIHPHSFIRSLNKAGIPAGFDTENRKHCRIWLNDFVGGMRLQSTGELVSTGRIGVNAWLPNPETGRNVETFITTLQHPYGPEWSIMRFDAYNVPTNERYRGWRTTLLELIKKEVITEEEAHRAFGEPIGPASLLYREQLYKHRSCHYGVSRREP